MSVLDISSETITCLRQIIICETILMRRFMSVWYSSNERLLSVLDNLSVLSACTFSPVTENCPS